MNNSASERQVAIDKQDIALAREVMAHDVIAAGRLVRLFDEVICASSLAYYVIHRPGGNACQGASLPRAVAGGKWQRVSWI